MTNTHQNKKTTPECMFIASLISACIGGGGGAGEGWVRTGSAAAFVSSGVTHSAPLCDVSK